MRNLKSFSFFRPTNARERMLKSQEMVEVAGNRDVIVRQSYESRATKKFTFDRAFGMDSQQVRANCLDLLDVKSLSFSLSMTSTRQSWGR